MDIFEKKDTSDSYEGQSGKKKSKFPVLPIAVGVGLLLVLSNDKFNFFSPPDGDAALAGALTPTEINNLLSNDNSPIAFTVPSGKQLTIEQRLSLLDQIGAKFSLEIDNIANNLATDAADVFNRLGLTLSGALPPGSVMTEKGLELYLTQLDNWSKVYGITAAVVGNEVTKIILGAQSTDVTSCTATTFVKDVTEESTSTQQTSASVTVTATAKNGFLGIFGKRKKSESVTTAQSISTRTDYRHVAYIPHCTNYEVDPVKYNALINTTVLGFKMQMASMKAIFAAAPDPFQFLTPSKNT